MAVNQNDRKRPAIFILQAMELLNKIDPDCNGLIVEIGSMRQPCNHPIEDTSSPCCNDGHSTIWWCKSLRDVITCDIDPNCIAIATESVRRWVLQRPDQRISTVAGCGLELMRRLREVTDKKISLLYLDAWDVGLNEYAESHLECFNLAEPNLAEKHIILIDDTDIESINGELFAVQDNAGGKGRLLVPELLRRGYKLHFRDRQTMLTKGID